ncbi:MAG: hypothetical protein A3C35_07715 [Omnitrophica bacterium RIFCSPHIGHO2_02_FULL_46_11]|nr:MAG: hypothetical protein A3C35_07715 [Omnitrophica bacterium RIFCSPHIGHO2_02_FULL_46_11]
MRSTNFIDLSSALFHNNPFSPFPPEDGSAFGGGGEGWDEGVNPPIRPLTLTLSLLKRERGLLEITKNAALTFIDENKSAVSTVLISN